MDIFLHIFTYNSIRKIINKKNMERLVLKQEIVEKIQNDGILFGKVAYILGVKPASLPQILAANKSKLTEVGVLRILCEHLGVAQDSELLTEMQEA